jgi:hypothetical protein
MAEETSHYGLEKLTAGEKFRDKGYKYTNADRDLIDLLLYIGAEGHTHTGAAAEDVSPLVEPSLTLQTTGGTIPAGTRVFYKYTLVDANGLESGPSPEAEIDTPVAINEPGAPALATSTTGGTLLAGNYYYVLSAFVTASTQETQARHPTYITVPPTTNTNTVTLTMPSGPSGATGFNIYRRKPGGSQYLYLDSVLAAQTSYTDTGAVAEDCNRVLPTRNNTNSLNSVLVALPGATPALEAGYSWRVYRTYVSSIYDTSLLEHVIDGEVTYEDVGNATTYGEPPGVSLAVGSPSKIDLESETTGSLPMGLTGHPFVVTFSYPGTLTAAVGENVWVCEFPAATIIGCRASLGAGSAPQATAVLVDVNKGTGATPTYTTIYTTQANRPYIPVGHQRGPRTDPNTRGLVVGDSLTVDVDQAGGGASPTDENLTVNIYLIAHGYPDDTSFVAGTTTGT